MKILVVDDEKHNRRLISDYLKNDGFEVIEAKDGMEGVNKVIENLDIDLVLLDVRMPKMDGFQTYEEIRGISDVPVIFLTALAEIHYEVKGLKLGAHDYITKPFSYEVLIARVNSCLLKVKKNQPMVLCVDKMTVNLTNRDVYIEDKSMALTQREFDVLEFLISHKNMAVNRNVILDRVWGYDYYGDPRTVDTHIKTLRAKMKGYGSMIKTVRGVGYYIEMD